jgi:hypothetical protein
MRHGKRDLIGRTNSKVSGHLVEMYEFPTSADLQFLLGKTLGQIALDPWSLQFRFVDGGQITVEGRIEHIDASGLSHPHDCQERTGEALFLHQLLFQAVTEVHTEPICLSLTFADGAILRIFSGLGGLECGQINFLKSGHGYWVF